MLNVLFGTTAENDFVKYIVHWARSNDGNDSDFFLRKILT